MVGPGVFAFIEGLPMSKCLLHDFPELGRSVEVVDEPVLGDGKCDPARGVAAREAATDATYAEHAVGVFRRRTETPDRVAQPPGRRVAEALIGATRGPRVRSA